MSAQAALEDEGSERSGRDPHGYEVPVLSSGAGSIRLVSPIHGAWCGSPVMDRRAACEAIRYGRCAWRRGLPVQAALEDEGAERSGCGPHGYEVPVLSSGAGSIRLVSPIHGAWCGSPVMDRRAACEAIRYGRCAWRRGLPVQAALEDEGSKHCRRGPMGGASGGEGCRSKPPSGTRAPSIVGEGLWTVRLAARAAGSSRPRGRGLRAS